VEKQTVSRSTKRVLVTDATIRPGLVAIQSLAKAGFDVIAADSRRLPFALHSRYTPPYFRLPSQHEPTFLAALLALLENEKVDILVPLFCVEAVARHRAAIEERAAILVPPWEAFGTANDNRRTLEACAALGIPCPRILSLQEALTTLDAGSAAGQPPRVVLKPRKELGGSRGVHILADAKSLLRARDRVENMYGPAVIVEYIPGEAEAMRAVNVILDKRSGLAAYFTFKKVREYPTSGGVCGLGVSTHEKELVDMVLPLLQRWKWQGPADIEFKIDSRDQEPKLIEINPRVSGNLGFATNCGVAFPEIAADLALGRIAEDCTPPDYPAGVMGINVSYYVKSILSDAKTSGVRSSLLSAAWSELTAKRARTNGALTDPLPLIGKAALELSSWARSFFPTRRE